MPEARPDERSPRPSAPPTLVRPRHDGELGFVRRPMVRWLDPHQLLGTAARVVASGFTTSYTDSRELQVHMAAEVYDRSAGDELWFDYVADLGDGWNSTYTVAWLLSQDHVDVELDGQAHHLPRGPLLVMGGDQVYPVPTRTQYENRLLGPYRAALPCPPPGRPPELLAIPGSHDWYDGLVNFVNVFCRRRPIGGRQTIQSRSYFAVRLPHRWWLWGIDTQFGDFLDESQLAYFAEAAQEMADGDQVVVCMAKEVESGRRSSEVCSDRTLAYLEREVVAPAGGRVTLYLKSGRHHYCRYAEAGGERHLVTAGGGGSFLHPTHGLAETVEPPGDNGGRAFAKAAVYPSEAFSRRLRKRVWLLPAYNLPLAAALGAVQVLVVFMLNLHLSDAHQGVGFADLVRALWQSPSAFLLIVSVIALFGAMIRLAHDARGLPRVVIALGHSALQTGGLALVIVVASALASPFDGAPSLLAFLALVWVFGGVGGVLGVSAYLWATNHMGFHANEAFAPLHHADQKNFLRLHVGPSGDLTVYPIGVERAGRRWRFDPGAEPHAPWLVPDGRAPAPHLVEAPIVLERR